MIFIPAVSVIALLAILPVLLSLRRTAAPGVQEFSAGCALSAAAIGLMAVAAALRMPVAAVLGYATLITAFMFIFLAFRRLLALAPPPVVFTALALAAGTAGLGIALGDHDGFAARAIVVAGLGAGLLLVIGLPALDRYAGKPAVQLATMGALTIVCTALIHALGPLSGIPSEHAASPPTVAFELPLAIMQALALPSLFLAVILKLQNRIIADLRTVIARDELTGVLSRGALIEEGERIFADCLSRHDPVAFLLLDLDYFKQINDHYGHACGDMALAHFAETVSTFLDSRGAFGRIGGEEFGIVLPNHTEDQAAALAEAICRIVRETPAGPAYQRIRLTVSIGIATAEPGDTIMDVMVRADMALYDSKADGRDRCSLARPRRLDASARALAAAAAQMRQADISRQEQLCQTA
jgi:diguanylate cyclase (GGDEF)-like protein